MNILVTGACGFIGSNFIKYEVEKYDDHFVVLDKLTYAGDIKNISDIKDRITFIRGDICDDVLVEDIFAKYHFDIVINFAAETHVDRSIIDPSVFVKTNVEGVSVLLKNCIKYKVKRFHQISTDEVYGDTVLDSDHRFKEDDPLHPNNPYSATKASGDLLVMSYHKTYGLDTIITRSSNNYGPNQHNEKYIPQIIDRLVNDKDILIYGDGNNKRDWLYVLDNCILIDKIMRKEETGTYNIATGIEYTNNDIASKILAILDKDISKVRYIQDRKGHDLRYALDISKIKALGLYPSIDIDEGLKRTVAWYMDNQAYLESNKTISYNDYLRKNYGE